MTGTFFDGKARAFNAAREKKTAKTFNNPAFPASPQPTEIDPQTVLTLAVTANLRSAKPFDRSTAGAIGTYRPIEINDPKKRLVPIESG